MENNSSSDEYIQIIQTAKAKKLVGDLTGALELYNQAILLTPNDHSVYAELSEIHLAKDEAENALSDITKALELNPNEVLYLKSRGDILFNSGKLEESIEEYSKAISLTPYYYAAYIGRGKSYYEIEEYEKALTDLNIGANDSFASFEVHLFRGMTNYCLGNYFESEEDYKIAMETLPNFLFVNFNLGLTYLAMHKFVEAEECLYSAIKSGLKDEQIVSYLAFSKYSRGLIDEGLKDLETLLDIPSSFANQILQFTIIDLKDRNLIPVYIENKIKSKKYSEAIAYFNNVIKSYPDVANLYLSRSVCFFGLENWDNALTDINQYILLEPEDSIGYYNKGLIFARKKLFQEAIKEFAYCLEKNPSHANARYCLAKAHYSNNKYSEALEVIKKHLSLVKQSPEAILLRGYILLETAKFSQAIIDFKNSLTVYPDDFYIYYNIGYCNLKLNEYLESIKYFSTALDFDSANLEANRHRAVAKYLLGDTEQAIQDIVAFETISYSEAEKMILELKIFLYGI